ncbi:MAG: tetratricopeptide repeat protein [Planctomycetaceae bacterium]|nr:tetratricopeptide repeat protein [Planctomycetaceae bacterium]
MARLMFVGVLACLCVPVLAMDEPSFAELEASLKQRITRNAQDASAWRMLGQLRLQQGDWDGALQALQTALQHDKLSVSAYFGVGQAAAQLGRHEDAHAALQKVLELAPDSEYAMQSLELLATLPESSGILPASYEIRTFDGSDLDPLIAHPSEDDFVWNDRIGVRLDFGSQYNSNVGLAPSSRELATDGLSSAQGLISATVKWYVLDHPKLRFGPIFDSDFTLNEGNFQNYDLQSYRPGGFVEGTVDWGGRKLKPRFQYLFTHDEFDGETFGNRHSLVSSLGSVWTKSHTSTAYWSIDNNHILNDGVDPDVSSQDGWSNTLGAVHDFTNRDSIFRLWRIGADIQNADTIGSTYRYLAGGVYGQHIMVLPRRVHLTLRGGFTYRDYYDFTLEPSRNTRIWRAGGELRKYFARGFSTAIVAQYDRFDSDNEQFTTERFFSGGVASWEY